MKKTYAFLLTIVLAISSLFSMTPLASAATTIYDPAIQQEYQDLKNQGVIDSSVSYETWATPYVEGLNFQEEQEEEINGTVHIASSNTVGSTYQEIKPAFTSMKAGDIFITSDSFGNGLSGHAAMAISSTAILMMRGIGYSSVVMSYQEWKDTYSKPGKRTWIYRHDDSVMAQKAADWARNKYWHPNGGGTQYIFPKYSLIANTEAVNPSYCSLLVFQAYKNTTYTSIRYPIGPNIIDPYALSEANPRTTSLWVTKPKLISTITNYRLY